MSKPTLFQPDAIATSLHQALKRDLLSESQVYLDTRDPLAFAKHNQQKTFLKKYVSTTTNQDLLTELAHEAFHKANKHMFHVNERLEVELPIACPVFSSSTTQLDRIHLRARHLISKVLGKYNVEDHFRACKHSGGTSIGVSFSDTTMEAKWTFPMSITEDLVPWFESYLAWDNSLAVAIKNHNDENPLVRAVEIIPGSRAATVDKTSTQRRFINIEGTINMFFQQGLMTLMYNKMARWGIDIKTLPEKHKLMAYVSSLTLRDATIDWAQASDCVSKVLVKRQFPVRWFYVIDQLRAKHILIDGELHEINMISPMGNATTFPVETLVFWAYAQATLHTDTSPISNSSFFPVEFDYGRCSVFGDDCIVPTAIAEHYIQVVTSIGFNVNKEKSFYDKTPFRESCGGDFLRGIDVRAFNLKAPLNDRLSSLEPWLYIVFNRLMSKYRQYYGELNYIYDRALFKELIRLFSVYNLKIRIVPDEYPDDAGLKLSDDISRFCECYPNARLHALSRSHHGTYSFSFVRFLYKEQKSYNDELRYNTWLKNPVLRPGSRMSITRQEVKSKKGHCGFTLLLQDYRVPDHEYKERIDGSYVVAKGITSHWFVPKIGVKN